MKFIKKLLLLFLLVILTACGGNEDPTTAILPNLNGLSRDEIARKLESKGISYQFMFEDMIYYSDDYFDQFVKYEEKVVTSNLIREDCINKGMMMGLCKDKRKLVLTITTILLSCLLTSTIYIILAKEGLVIIKLGLILLSAGAFSNALERYIYKHVIDYISFPNFFIKKIRNVIFNIADICIFVGSLISIIGALFI